MTRPRPARLSRRQFLGLSAAAATVAAAPAAAQPARRPFVSAKTTEAPSLDPIMEQALSRQRLDPLFYNRLVEWGHDGKLEPALAESWTTSADGRTWTFKLRRGVKFHNGRELVSEDVKYTYERILDPKVGLGWAWVSQRRRPHRAARRPDGAYRHQAAECLAAGRHGGRVVGHRPPRGRGKR